MNWLHSTIYERGQFRLTPYELLAFSGMVVIVVSAMFLIAIFG